MDHSGRPNSDDGVNAQPWQWWLCYRLEMLGYLRATPGRQVLGLAASCGVKVIWEGLKVPRIGFKRPSLPIFLGAKLNVRHDHLVNAGGHDVNHGQATGDAAS